MPAVLTAAFQPCLIALFGLTTILSLILVTRQMIFTASLATREDENPWESVDLYEWPTVAVVIPAHNEEAVLEGCLRAMRVLDYPEDRLEIIVVNDRSSDATGAIADRHAAQDPRVRTVHRPQSARAGKPAALKEIVATLTCEIMVLFDADYLPSPALLKRLVAPFIDPEVGATMGRVTPYNTGTNVLTRLIDLERRGGFAVDQEVRCLWNLLPQFGGTVGGLRLSALRNAGGWNETSLTEDTEITYRLFLAGYTVEYLDHAICYEESPENWRVRFGQIRRWAYGHNDCMLRYLWPVLTATQQPLLRRLDAAFVLLFYFLPVLSILSLIASLIYPTLYDQPPLNFTFLPALLFFVGFGNFTPYLQMAVACLRDGQPDTFRVAPLLFLSSTISMMASTYAFVLLIRNRMTGLSLGWDKTLRYRRESHVA
jgi:cellulose synthase/poly-beta-1,6-N-acetylglucosamine synthase-like glycosyltransferase